MASIPYDILYYNIFPHCDIDVKVAFKIPPKRLTSNLKIHKPSSLKTFELIARSHLQKIRSLYKWNEKIGELFTYFNIPDVNRDFLTMKLIFIPQYKIVHGDNWRQAIHRLPGVDIDHVHFMDEPDIRIYESLYPRDFTKYVNRKNLNYSN